MTYSFYLTVYSESVVCKDEKIRACKKRRMSSSFEIKCTNRPSYMSFCRKSCGGCSKGRCRHDIEYLTIFDEKNFTEFIV